MPPPAKRHCAIILYDVNTQNKNKALQTLLRICCKQYFTQSRDVCKLILVNSSRTRNRLNAHYGGFEHISEVDEEPTSFNPQTILDVIEDSPLGEANWLEALSVGAKCLSEDFNLLQGNITLQLLFITDLSSPLIKTETTIREIVDDLNSIGAYLYIVGPNTEAPHMIKNPDMIKIWMRDLEIDQNNPNLVTAKEIITGLNNGVVCNYNVGEHLFFSFRNWKGTQPWKVPLTVGTKIDIPAQTMKVLQEGMECKLVDDKSDGAIRVWVDAEDESIEIDEGNLVKGILRHDRFIEMPDRKMFQVANMRGFSVLCFSSSKKVPEYYMSSDCYYVLPNGNAEVMSVLVDTLAEKKKYIIAKRTYNNNFIPKIVALVPKPDHDPKCFILATLPFEEDIRLDYRERDAETVPKIPIDKNVGRFLDSMDAGNKEVIEKFPLGVNMLQDLNCERIIHKAADKLIGRKQLLGDFSPIETIHGDNDGLKYIWPARERHQVAKKEESDDSSGDDDW